MYKAIPIEDYYLIVSDKPAGDWGKEWDGQELIAVETKVKDKFPGLPLFDARWEVDVNKLALNYYNLNNVFSPITDYALAEKYATFKAFIAGYLKRSETHKWTDEDMEAAACFGMSLERFKDDKNKLRDTEEFKGFIQSLQKPKVYEVELEMICCNHRGVNGECMTPNCLGFQPKITNNKVNILSYKPI